MVHDQPSNVALRSGKETRATRLIALVAQIVVGSWKLVAQMKLAGYANLRGVIRNWNQSIAEQLANQIRGQIRIGADCALAINDRQLRPSSKQEIHPTRNPM